MPNRWPEVSLLKTVNRQEWLRNFRHHRHLAGCMITILSALVPCSQPRIARGSSGLRDHEHAPLSSKPRTGRLGCGGLGIEVQHVLHARNVFAVNLRNARYVLAHGHDQSTPETRRKSPIGTKINATRRGAPSRLSLRCRVGLPAKIAERDRRRQTFPFAPACTLGPRFVSRSLNGASPFSLPSIRHYDMRLSRSWRRVAIRRKFPCRVDGTEASPRQVSVRTLVVGSAPTDRYAGLAFTGRSRTDQISSDWGP